MAKVKCVKCGANAHVRIGKKFFCLKHAPKPEKVEKPAKPPVPLKIQEEPKKEKPDLTAAKEEIIELVHQITEIANSTEEVKGEIKLGKVQPIKRRWWRKKNPTIS